MSKMNVSDINITLNNPFASALSGEFSSEIDRTSIFMRGGGKKDVNTNIDRNSLLKDVLENDAAEIFEYTYDINEIEAALNNGGIVPEFDQYNVNNKINLTDTVGSAQKKIVKQQKAAANIQIEEEKNNTKKEIAQNAEELAKDAEERAKRIEQDSQDDKSTTDEQLSQEGTKASELVRQSDDISTSDEMKMSEPISEQFMSEAVSGSMYMFELNNETDSAFISNQSMTDEVQQNFDGMSQDELLELQTTYTQNLSAIQKFDEANPLPSIDLPASLQSQSDAISAAKDNIDTQTNAQAAEEINNQAAQNDVIDKENTAGQKEGVLQDINQVISEIQMAIMPLQAATKMMFAQANSVIATGEGIIAGGEATVASGAATVAAGQAALSAAYAAFPVSSGAVAAAKAMIASGKAQITSGKAAIASGTETVASGTAMEANAAGMEATVNSLQQGLMQANTLLQIAQGDFNFAELAVNTALDTLGASDTQLGQVVRAVQDAKSKYEQCITIYQTAKAVATGNYQQALMGIAASLDSWDKLKNGTPQKEGMTTNFGKNLEKNFTDNYWKLSDDQKFDGKNGLSGNYMKDMLTSGAELAGFLGADNFAMAAGIAGEGLKLSSGESTFQQSLKSVSQIAASTGNTNLAEWGNALASASDGIEKYNDRTAARASLKERGYSNPTEKELNAEIINIQRDKAEKKVNENVKQSLIKKGITNPTKEQIEQEKQNIQNTNRSRQEAIASLNALGIKKPTENQINSQIDKENKAKNSLNTKGNNNPVKRDILQEVISDQYREDAIASLKKKGNNNPTDNQIAIEIAYNYSNQMRNVQAKK